MDETAPASGATPGRAADPAPRHNPQTPEVTGKAPTLSDLEQVRRRAMSAIADRYLQPGAVGETPTRP